MAMAASAARLDEFGDSSVCPDVPPPVNHRGARMNTTRTPAYSIGDRVLAPTLNALRQYVRGGPGEVIVVDAFRDVCWVVCDESPEPAQPFFFHTLAPEPTI